MIALTPKEKQKFIEYCRQEVELNRAITERMEKQDTPVYNALSKRKRAEMHAHEIAARVLESTEEYTVQ